MSYTISNPDGSTLVILGDRKIDQAATSLTLVGKNWTGYGEYINNNFVTLLANHASPSSSPPRSPVRGQIWYDTTLGKLKVYDEAFKPITGAILASTLPDSLTSGDLWFDTANEQLKVLSNNNTLYTIGPAFPRSVGEIGFVLPSIPLRDFDEVGKNVSLLRNHGTFLGYIANEEFRISASEDFSYITTATTSTVRGLTIIGDINYSGKIKDRYLPLAVNFDTIFSTTTSTNRDISSATDFTIQHQAIVDLLEKVYPINTTTGVVTLNPPVTETGVPVGSEARVVCEFSLPAKGYQVRRYIAKVAGWDFYSINTSTTTLTNVVYTLYQGDIA